jgi:hypothetical protein
MANTAKCCSIDIVRAESALGLNRGFLQQLQIPSPTFILDLAE